MRLLPDRSRSARSRRAGRTSERCFEPLESRCLLSTIFWEDFEGAAGSFTQAPGTWSRYSNNSAYQWSESLVWAQSGGQSLFCAGYNGSGSTNDYPQNLDSQFWQYIDLRAFQTASLTFRAHWDIEAGKDYCRLYLGTTQNVVWEVTDWSGDTFQQVTLNMDQFAGQDNVLIWFRFTSDGNDSASDYGVWIDDLVFSGTRPDLVSTAFNVEPENGMESGRLIPQLDFTIRNIGDAPVTASFVVRFILSTDNRFGAYDKLLGAMTISDDFAPGQSRSYSRDNALRLPHAEEWLPYSGTGTYFIGYIVDYRNWVWESDEGNNRNHGTENIDWDAARIEVVERGDLRGVGFDISHNARNAGETIPWINYAIDNIGHGTITQNFAVRFYLSTDNKFGYYDYFLGGVQINRDFTNGQQWSWYTDEQNLTLRLPNAGAWMPYHGTNIYFVGMIVDFWNSVPELNENNNKNRARYQDFEQLIIVLPDPKDDGDRRLDQTGAPGPDPALGGKGDPGLGDLTGDGRANGSDGFAAPGPTAPMRGPIWDLSGLAQNWLTLTPDSGSGHLETSPPPLSDYFLIRDEGAALTPRIPSPDDGILMPRLWRLDDQGLVGR